MTVYVDAVFEAHSKTARHTRWCHMMADGSDDELHAMANRLGLKRTWFQGDHYDITPPKRALAIQYGAVECETMKMVEIRRSKRKTNALQPSDADRPVG